LGFSTKKEKLTGAPLVHSRKKEYRYAREET